MNEKINAALIPLAVPIENLHEDPKNARKHPEKNIKAIMASFEKFGQQKPIVALKDGTVIAGNGTIEALKRLGWERVAVVRFDSEDKAHAVAFAIADNRTAELATWDEGFLLEGLKDIKLELPDFDFSAIGFNEGEIQKICGRDAADGEDDVPEPRKTDIKRGDIFTLGNHRLMCGDSTSAEDVCKLMAGEKADMVFTDPPYGVSYAEKNTFLNSISRGNRIQTEIENDQLNTDGIQAFWKKAFEIIRENLAPINSYYITGPQIQGMMMMMMMMMMMAAGLPYRHVIIWVKNNHVLGRCDYNYKHEPLFFGWVGKHEFYGEGQFKTSVWNVDKPLKSDLHPTMKPVELIENAILNSSKPDQVVLDIFGGSGSTLIACEKKGRKCRMMEISENYCQVIIDRWEKLTGKKAEKVVS